jgi:hypothetical protein
MTFAEFLDTGSRSTRWFHALSAGNTGQPASVGVGVGVGDPPIASAGTISSSARGRRRR